MSHSISLLVEITLRAAQSVGITLNEGLGVGSLLVVPNLLLQFVVVKLLLLLDVALPLIALKLQTIAWSVDEFILLAIVDEALHLLLLLKPTAILFLHSSLHPLVFQFGQLLLIL